MRIPTLETARLRLRAFKESDAPALHRILSQPKMLQYFPGPDEAPPVEKAVRFIERQQAMWEDRGYAWWAVEEKATGRLLGWNGLQYLPETDETEIGYLIDREVWGQGLTTEAGHVGLRFGFEECSLEQIIALAHPDNAASRRVMEKLGLAFDCITEYFEMTVARYALTAAEYAARTQSPTAS